MATLVRADGRVESLAPTEGRYLSLAQLQWAVGGYIEMVKFAQAGLWVVCNEDGRHQQLPRNRAYPMFLGDIVLCRFDEVE